MLNDDACIRGENSYLLALQIHTVEGQEVGHLRIKGNWARMHSCFGLLDCVKLWTSDLTCWADTQEVTNVSQSGCVG
jgi:hypothetical protein